MALHLSQLAFAGILGVNKRMVGYIEARADIRHHCMSRSSQIALALYLTPHRAELEKYGVAYPFDNLLLVHGYAPIVATTDRCSSCNFLLGPGHLARSELPEYCQICYGHIYRAGQRYAAALAARVEAMA